MEDLSGETGASPIPVGMSDYVTPTNDELRKRGARSTTAIPEAVGRADATAGRQASVKFSRGQSSSASIESSSWVAVNASALNRGVFWIDRRRSITPHLFFR